MLIVGAQLTSSVRNATEVTGSILLLRALIVRLVLPTNIFPGLVRVTPTLSARLVTLRHATHVKLDSLWTSTVSVILNCV